MFLLCQALAAIDAIAQCFWIYPGKALAAARQFKLTDSAATEALLKPPACPTMGGGSTLALAVACSFGVAAADWLVHPPATAATVQAEPGGCALRLTNGLLERTFAVPGAGCPVPNFATIDLADTTNPDMPCDSPAAVPTLRLFFRLT